MCSLASTWQHQFFKVAAPKCAHSRAALPPWRPAPKQTHRRLAPKRTHHALRRRLPRDHLRPRPRRQGRRALPQRQVGPLRRRVHRVHRVRAHARRAALAGPGLARRGALRVPRRLLGRSRYAILAAKEKSDEHASSAEIATGTSGAAAALQPHGGRARKRRRAIGPTYAAASPNPSATSTHIAKTTLKAMATQSGDATATMFRTSEILSLAIPRGSRIADDAPSNCLQQPKAALALAS